MANPLLYGRRTRQPHRRDLVYSGHAAQEPAADDAAIPLRRRGHVRQAEGILGDTLSFG